MGDDVLNFQEIDRTQIARVGGKGAHLGELSRIDGVRVPPGFCVTTAAFDRVVAGAPAIDGLIDRLAPVAADDRDEIRVRSEELRRAVEAIAVPADLTAAIAAAHAGLGDQVACAVRSSATAEDLPTASFAGQQDTYLNVVGIDGVLDHLVRCWASLFTERAVTYRLRNGFDHRTVRMAVVVQRMVAPTVSGILFTADPITSNRRIARVEAGYGLGEALVAGLVDPDSYAVRDGEVVSRTIGTKQLMVVGRPGGGTQEMPVAPDRRDEPALTDEQVLRLVALGRRIETHLGGPQDIEWCLADDDIQIVQSRPITTLFPIPPTDDDANHVYLSVGHQQMMTEPMKPLGLAFWQMTTPRPMAEAGGRLFVDVTAGLATPAGRAGLLEVMGRSDPLMADALRTVLDRDGFVPEVPDDGGAGRPSVGVPLTGAPAAIEADPDLVQELIGRTDASIAGAKRAIEGRSGPALLDAIREDIEELRRILFDPQGLPAIMAGMEAAWWLNDQLQEWLGEKNVADTLTLSVPHNVTSEMGLALLDVADAIRPHPAVVAFLAEVDDDTFLARMDEIEGGPAARAAIEGFLDRYGMRCVGEIDITRPRWRERPSMLLPLILGNVEHFESGAAERRFDEGLRAAREKEREVLERVRALPDGEAKADETRRMIDRVRTFSGYREYPKYGMISRYLVYKQALMTEAERLVGAGVLREAEDIFFLRFTELHDVLRTDRVDHDLIARRKEDFRAAASLVPPRVLTSDGEAVAGSYRRDDVPAGALVGLPVSSGVVEGRARIIHDMAEADVETGDILVTASTDPSWSPLFVAVAGLVTEVGGLMTHGAVVAREYGLPAIVGVEGATRRIRDGQRIRLHGTDGYVELLP